MYASLTFQFPHNQRQVPVRVFVPQPERRPRTVANFAFMCTGELPPPDMLDALRIPRSDIAYKTSEEARQAGLKPFAETSVVRVEKRVMLEIGGSTSKSIFGGFIPDERLDTPSLEAPSSSGPTAAPTVASIAVSLPMLKAGTVLCGNIGMPDSHASRYYILLADVAEKERASYSCYTPLGMVTSGLEQLVAFTNNVPVQPRSLEPLKKVALTAIEFDFNYSVLAGETFSPARTAGGGDGGAHREKSKLERISGRVRRRDESDDEEQNEEGDDSTVAGTQAKGFFHFEARYPVGGGRGRKAGGVAASASVAPAAKRLRTENAVLAIDEDGFPILRNTAIEEAYDNDDNVNREDSAGGERRSFSYFNAQEAAFMNDIEVIKEKQLERTHNRMNRIAKQSTSSANSSGGYGTVSARKIRERALKSQESRVSSKKGKGKKKTMVSSSRDSATSTTKRRDVTKRY